MAIPTLVVDGCSQSRQALRRVLETLGCQVVAEAGTGRDTLILCGEHYPDLVTLDMNLPDAGGIEVLRQLRAIGRDARILVVSARNQRETLLEALREGADDYVVKPFDEARIRISLARLTAGVA